MRISSSVFVGVLLLGNFVPGLVVAQPTPTEEADPAAEKKPEEKADEKPAADVTAASDRFNIRRGFFAEGDLGVFLTFAGRNTNRFELPKRFTSNVQPYLGLTFGYDIVHSDAFSFALGVKLAMGLSGGAGRVSEAELADPTAYPTTKSNDYSVMQMGLAASLGILLTDRLALTIKAEGCGGVLDPDPKVAALTGPSPGVAMDGAGGSAFAPVVGAGIGVEYFTLLNDFSVGALLRFVAVLHDGLIPGASITIPIKYTF